MRSSSSSLFLSLVLLFIPFHTFFFFSFPLPPLFFLSRGEEKRLTSHENRWLRSHLIIGIEFSFEERSTRTSLPYFSRRTYMDIRICYYGQFLLSFFFLFGSSWRIVVVEGNGGLLSSFESLPERTNRRWPIFISAISALWGTRGERCVMLVKCDLFLFLCVCICVYIYFFFQEKERERNWANFR